MERLRSAAPPSAARTDPRTWYAGLRRRWRATRQGRALAATASFDGSRHVVVVGGADGVLLANDVANRLPGARVHAFLPPKAQTSALADRIVTVTCASMADRIDALVDLPDVDLVIEALPARGDQRVRALARLFPLLRPGARYAIVRPEPPVESSTRESLGDVLREVTGLVDRGENRPRGRAAHGWLGLAAAIASVSETDEVTVLVKRGEHRLKLPDAQATEVLDRHRGSGWGRVHATTPEQSYTPRGRLEQYGDGPAAYRAVPRITVPARDLREYTEVLMTSNQRVYDDRFFMPDTFRHLTKQMGHRALSSIDAHSAGLMGVAEQEPRRLSGRYFFLDTEYPGHFGHVTSEVLGRVSGWRRARELAPDLRPVLSLATDQDAMPGFQRTLFEALGIPVDDVAYVRHGEVVRVESLWAQASDFSNPVFASPDLLRVWDEIGSGLAIPDYDGPRRLFVTRGTTGVRNCRSMPEVEQFFADEGFAVVRPERFPLAEQISMFRGAEVLAGFAGSALFTTMFAGPQRRILIASGGYTARNEYLISALRGGELHVFWGPPDVAQPSRGWAWNAFQADFDFDVAANADLLRRVIETGHG